MLKRELILAPIIVAPDWSIPFEIMCDASSMELKAILGERQEVILQPIYFARKALNTAKKNYIGTK